MIKVNVCGKHSVGLYVIVLLVKTNKRILNTKLIWSNSEDTLLSPYCRVRNPECHNIL